MASQQFNNNDEDAYEQAARFLRDFHSTCVITVENRPSALMHYASDPHQHHHQQQRCLSKNEACACLVDLAVESGAEELRQQTPREEAVVTTTAAASTFVRHHPVVLTGGGYEEFDGWGYFASTGTLRTKKNRRIPHYLQRPPRYRKSLPNVSE